MSSRRANDPRDLLKEFRLIEEEPSETQSSEGPIKRVAKGVRLKTGKKVLVGKRVPQADAAGPRQMSSEEYKRLLVRQYQPRAVPSRAQSDRNHLLAELEDEDIVMSKMGSVRISQDAERSTVAASNAEAARTSRPKDLSAVRVQSANAFADLGLQEYLQAGTIGTPLGAKRPLRMFAGVSATPATTAGARGGGGATSSRAGALSAAAKRGASTAVTGFGGHHQRPSTT